MKQSNLRFNITYHAKKAFCGYKVSIPNYNGGEVVDAESYDALRSELESVRKERDAYKNTAEHYTTRTDEAEFALAKMREAMEEIATKPMEESGFCISCGEDILYGNPHKPNCAGTIAREALADGGAGEGQEG